jgi:tetratricopeptide (TPR) repeat protein
LVGSLVAALIALVAPAAATPQQSWSDRAATLDGCELEALVNEMVELAPSMPRSDTDFGLGFRQATCILIGTPRELLWTEPDLLARVQRARLAAEQWGPIDDRLRVENEYAKTLLASGDADTARAVLLEALARFTSARRSVTESLELLVDQAARTRRFEEGLALADQCESLLSELVDEESDPARANWLDFHLLQRVRVLGTRSSMLLLLGLPDVAARVMRAEQDAARDLRGLPSAAEADVRARMDQILLDLSMLEFADAVKGCDALLAAHPEIDPVGQSGVLGFKAIALSWMAREGLADVETEAVQRLDALLADKNLRSDLRGDVLLALASLELRAHDFSAAEAHLDQARAIFDGPSRDPDPSHGELNRELEIAYRARLALERGDARAELEARRAALERACQAMFARQAELPLRSGGVGPLHWANPRVLISELIRCAIAEEGESRGIEQGVALIDSAYARGTLARSLGIPETSLAEIRSHLLGSDHGLLIYLPACDRTHLFVIDAERERAFELASRGELVAAIRPFASRSTMPPERSDASGPSSERGDPLSADVDKLRRLLLPDEALASMQHWKGFYIVGADLLAETSFERLPLPSGRTLGVEYAVCRLPSLPFGVWLANRAGARASDAARSKLAVFAATDREGSRRAPGSALAPIVLSSADRSALFAARREADGLVVEGRDATRSRLFSDEIAGVEMLEIFTHGVLDLDRERPAGLALGPDEREGVLWCEDVEAGFRSPPVVALFACESGVGPVRLGDDGASQLGVSFLARGAETVLVGHAPLALGAMVELAHELDRGLTSGVPRAEALRRARQKLAESRRWSDPFYYANVSMIGLGWDDASRAHALRASSTPRGAGDDVRAEKTWMLLAGTVVGSIAFWIANRARRKRAGSVANA